MVIYESERVFLVARLVDKQKKFDQYKEDLEQAKVAIVADYRGLSVAQLSDLRQTLFKQDAKFSVVKNTLMKRAIHGTDGATLEDFLQGPMAVLFGFGDEITPTKTLKEFLQKAKIGEIKGGYIGGQKLSQKEALALAELPPLEELRGMLLGAINSPLAGLVMSLAGPQRALVNVLDQYAKQKEQMAS
jgi:large subunit ribosomal protein L10